MSARSISIIQDAGLPMVLLIGCCSLSILVNSMAISASVIDCKRKKGEIAESTKQWATLNLILNLLSILCVFFLMYLGIKGARSASRPNSNLSKFMKAATKTMSNAGTGVGGNNIKNAMNAAQKLSGAKVVTTSTGS